MFLGFIGGNCVIPNLELIHDQTLDLINKMNNDYARKLNILKKNEFTNLFFVILILLQLKISLQLYPN